MQGILYNLFSSWHLSAGLAESATLISILIMLCGLSYILIRVTQLLCKTYLLSAFKHYLNASSVAHMEQLRLLEKITYLVPGLVFLQGSSLLIFHNTSWSQQLAQCMIDISLLYLLFAVLKAMFSCFDFAIQLYQRSAIKNKKPIRSYIQFIKILLIIMAGILAISIVLDKSPVILFTGLGALSAVILLVFKDTITGFVANIQLAAL